MSEFSHLSDMHRAVTTDYYFSKWAIVLAIVSTYLSNRSVLERLSVMKVIISDTDTSSLS